jgi:hypothetical protein
MAEVTEAAEVATAEMAVAGMQDGMADAATAVRGAMRKDGNDEGGCKPDVVVWARGAATGRANVKTERTGRPDEATGATGA